MKNFENFNFTVVPQDFLNQIQTDLQEMKKILSEKAESEVNAQWIESVKVPDILGISRKTWQTYRDKRMIPFSQIGSKIYVKRADLENFMNRHYIESEEN